MKNTHKFQDEEIWKEIKLFPKYQISSNGRVKNKKRGNILKNRINNTGYEFVVLYDNDNKEVFKYIHYLVAEAFIANPKQYRFIEHINGVLTDNRVENLKWIKVDKTITPHCEEWIKTTIKKLRSKMTIPEQKFYNECIDAGISLKYQQAEYVNGNIYFIDFKVSNLNIAIEIDGKYHNDAEQANKDKIRTKNLNKLKYNVFRITNSEVCNKTSVKYFITQLNNLIRRKPSTLKAKYRIRVVPDSEY